MIELQHAAADPVPENHDPRVVRAVLWNLLASGSAHIANLVRVVITARVLRPEDFGLFGITMIVYGALAVFTDFGLRPAFIAHRFESDEERDDWVATVWSAEVIIKIGMCALLALLAYPTALYFNEPEATWLTIVIGFSPMIRAMGNPALIVLEKKIEFRKIATYEAATAIGSSIITAVCALLLRSVWALAISHVISAVFSTAFTYWLAPGKFPKLRLVREPLRQAMKFGRPLLALSIMNFLAGRFDSMVIARRLGAAALGGYMVAMRLVEIPVGLVSYEVGRVLMPYYSEVRQKDPDALGTAFLKSATYLTWCLLAIYVPLFFYADTIVHLIFGEKWSASAPFVQILAISGILRAGTRTLGTLLQAMHVPSLDARSMAFEVGTLIVAALYAIPRMGAIGAAWAVVASFGVGFTIRFAFVYARLTFPERFGWRPLLRPAVGAAVAFAIASLVQSVSQIRILGLAMFLLTIAALAWYVEPGVRGMVTQVRTRLGLA